MTELEAKIGYRFRNIELMNEALTHSSYANEHKAQHVKYNERLEFLGDAVLSIGRAQQRRSRETVDTFRRFRGAYRRDLY